MTPFIHTKFNKNSVSSSQDENFLPNLPPTKMNDRAGDVPAEFALFYDKRDVMLQLEHAAESLGSSGATCSAADPHVAELLTLS